MTISEAVAHGIARLTRPEWSWNSYLELTILNREFTGGEPMMGPWVDVVSAPFVESVLFSAVPQDDRYAPWVLPEGKVLPELYKAGEG